MRVGRPRSASFDGALIGPSISAMRRAAGMTQHALALHAGMSLNTLVKVEQGRTRDPGVFKVAAICAALSISIDELIRAADGDHKIRKVPMSHGIVSVGYEGRTIEAFVAALQRVGVRTVADVRLNAISRKAGFSKTRLRQSLAAAGIDYRHMRSLGNSKDNREPFWSGRLEEGHRVFRAALQSPEAESSLHELAALAASEVVAVLCFESDIEMCHRKVIIDEVVQAKPIPVVPLPAD